MEPDIAEQLKWTAKNARDGSAYIVRIGVATLEEAASEILRLRAELAAAHRMYAACTDALAAARDAAKMWEDRANAAALAVPVQPDDVTWALSQARDAALEEAASVADDEANANAAMDLHSREEAAASIAGNIRTLKATP